MPPTICVLGAGIIGLSTAVRIQDNVPNADITVIADKFSPFTTSDGSAGFWEPHLLNEGQTKLIKSWGRETFERLLHLSTSHLAGRLGVHLVSGYNFTPFHEDPEWKNQVFGYRQTTEEELKLCPGAKKGSFYTTLIIDVKSYLPWLMQRFKASGGKVQKKQVLHIDELLSDYDIIVNCAGLGSYQLMGDKSMVPIRGQVIKVKAPWLKHFMIQEDANDEQTVTYIIPGKEHVTLGGTGQANKWNTDVNLRDRQRIWQDCLALAPSLKDAIVIEDWVGLRPQRTSVRVEMETKHIKGKQKVLVHNYGHSGSGVTLHWGCANHAARLVQEAVDAVNRKSKL